jgi:serpin B
MQRLGEFSGPLLVCLALLVLGSCSENDVVEPVGSNKGTDTKTALGNRIDDNNELAFKIYGLLDPSSDNLLVSPHSIVTAMGMVYAAAKNNTAIEMADALCFDTRQEVFHPSIKELSERLKEDQSSSTELVVANGFWGQIGQVLMTRYVDVLTDYYDADIDPMNFANHPEQSRRTINLWISDQTRGLIPELLQQGTVHSNTWFVLANTIYFKAKWSDQFDPEKTDPKAFEKLDGSEPLVPTMHGKKTMPFFAGDGYRAVEMRYKGSKYSMMLILPDAGAFKTVEGRLDADLVGTIVDGFENASVTMSLPKFSFGSYFDLIDMLETLGMNDAFTAAADFSGMDGVDDGFPVLDFVVHETFISIDEFGTTAAAATAAGGAGTSLPPPPAEFHAKRPFIFAIRHIDTGTILFLGRVLDPES